MVISIERILAARDVNELKSLGSYREVKRHLDSHLGFSVGARGWDSFHATLTAFKRLAEQDKALASLAQESCLLSAEKRIHSIAHVSVNLPRKVAVRTLVVGIQKTFGRKSFDPYRRFEETKARNFRNSSKLEGLVIPPIEPALSLESILAKHRR